MGPDREVVQIVPRLPPPAEGVGSFAEGLAAALAAGPAVSSIGSRLLAAGPEAPGSVREAGAFAARLEREAGDGPVLLHYVGYGYEPRGCPGWLVDALAAWKAKGEGRRLVSLFHEVYASGPPWRSSFWLSPAQRRLAARLARLSDGRVTSLAHYRGLIERVLIERWTPGAQVAVLPVFSTVGEPAEPPPLAARARRLVVFGGPGARARAYGCHAGRLESAVGKLGIEEILDVGPPGSSDAPASLAGRPVRRLGELPAAEAGALLSGSIAGFAAYPPRFLAKSTVFAACCAHGMLPLCAAPGQTGGEADILDVPPFWEPACGEDLQAVADRALAWYRPHRAAAHAGLYRGLLFP